MAHKGHALRYMKYVSNMVICNVNKVKQGEWLPCRYKFTSLHQIRQMQIKLETNELICLSTFVVSALFCCKHKPAHQLQRLCTRTWHHH